MTNETWAEQHAIIEIEREVLNLRAKLEIFQKTHKQLSPTNRDYAGTLNLNLGGLISRCEKLRTDLKTRFDFAS